MGTFLNVQFSIFTNHRIAPTASNVTTLMGKINDLKKFEFLPNVVSTQNIDLGSGQLNAVSNLVFITASNQSQIMCMDNRIDCVFNFDPSCDDTLETSISFCKKVLNIIMQEYSILGNRLAINVNKISSALPENFKETHFGKKLIVCLDYYEQKNLVEWSTRYNTRTQVEISNKNEVLNVITDLTLAKDMQNESKKILCHLDINTVPENQAYRFSCEDLEAFMKESIKVITPIINDFERLDACG